MCAAHISNVCHRMSYDRHSALSSSVSSERRKIVVENSISRKCCRLTPHTHTERDQKTSRRCVLCSVRNCEWGWLSAGQGWFNPTASTCSLRHSYSMRIHGPYDRMATLYGEIRTRIATIAHSTTLTRARTPAQCAMNTHTQRRHIAVVLSLQQQQPSIYGYYYCCWVAATRNAFYPMPWWWWKSPETWPDNNYGPRRPEKWKPITRERSSAFNKLRCSVRAPYFANGMNNEHSFDNDKW